MAGFVFNWASAFTAFFCRSLGEGGGKLASFVLRNILGIPVWAYGFVLASRQSSSPFFVPNRTTGTLGWLLIVVGTIPIIWALLLLGWRSFRPTRQDTLVSEGIYKFIRHPIYSGVIIYFIGFILLRPTPTVIIACALGWGYIFIQARLEELDLVQRLPSYRQYMEQVPRFFPRLGKK